MRRKKYRCVLRILQNTAYLAIAFFPPNLSPCISANKQRGPLSSCGTEKPCIPFNEGRKCKAFRNGWIRESSMSVDLIKYCILLYLILHVHLCTHCTCMLYGTGGRTTNMENEAQPNEAWLMIGSEGLSTDGN